MDHKLPLSALLAKPFQRIMKYHLLLEVCSVYPNVFIQQIVIGSMMLCITISAAPALIIQTYPGDILINFLDFRTQDFGWSIMLDELHI